MTIIRAKFAVTLIGVSMAAMPLASPAHGAPPHDALLPNDTAVFLHTTSLQQLEDTWNHVQFARVLADERMAAFRRELRKYVDSELQEYTTTTGFTLHELFEFARDAVTIAVVPGDHGQAVYVVLADVRGREEEAEQFVTEAGRRLHAGGAVGSVRQAGPIQFISYLATAQDQPPREAAFVLYDGLFGVTTGVVAMDDLARRWNGGDVNTLADREAYRRVMAVCDDEPGDGPPHGRVFVDPIAYLRLTHPPIKETLDKRDPIESLTKHGIDAVRGVGGVLNLGADATEVTVRLSVYAPGPHRGAMNMVRLPACRRFVPPEWLTDDVHMFAAINLDLTAVLDHLGPVFDDVIGDGVEGTFDDILSDLKAKDGPQVDVREDLVANLGPRLLFVSDAASSTDPRSERSLIAIEATDDAAVAMAIKKLLRDDPGVTRFRLSALDNDLWEIGADAATISEDDPQRKLTSSAVMVVNGHVLLGTNAHLVRKLVAAGRASGAKLMHAEDLHRLESCLARYTPGESVGRVYSRTSRDLRATYELLRSGGDRPSESLLGMIVGRLLAALRDQKTGELPVDFTTLPPFDEIAGYLGWIGATGKNRDDGWYVVGVALAPDAP